MRRPGRSIVALAVDPPGLRREASESFRGPLREIVSVAVDRFLDLDGVTRTCAVAGPLTFALVSNGGGVDASRLTTRTPNGGGGVRWFAGFEAVDVAEGLALAPGLGLSLPPPHAVNAARTPRADRRRVTRVTRRIGEGVGT
jgi:hypothetical protein